MNTRRLSSELIRALRGHRSQTSVSRRLGYSSNVVYTWESGRRCPSASEFFRLAARSRSDALSKVHAFSEHRLPRACDLRTRQGIAELLNVFAAGRRIVELAGSMNTDRATVSRWLHGQTEPRLPETLRFIQLTTQRLLEFVSIFANPAELASTRKTYLALLIQRRLAYDVPWSHAVLRALELNEYRRQPRHQPGFIAAHLGITLEEEEELLAALVASRQVRRTRGRYVLPRILAVDTRPNEVENRRLKAHWARVGVERLLSADAAPSALFSYNLFAIGHDDYERIRRLHVEYYERIREIVADAHGADQVVLMNLQLFPLQRRPIDTETDSQPSSE